MRLVFPAPLYEDFKYTCVPAPGVETAAIAFTVGGDVALSGKSSARRLVKEIWLPKEEDYHDRTRVSVAMKSDFVLSALIHAQTKHYGVVFLHTHPGTAYPTFSPEDDKAEAALRNLFEARAPGRPHVSVVVGTVGVSARVLGHPIPVKVSVLGKRLQVISPIGIPSNAPEERYSRQVDVLSAKGQEALAQEELAIVGLGGNGSLVAQQAAYLGFRKFYLVDTDRIDETNLNRVVGALPSDIGALKVDVARRMILSINPDAEVIPVPEDVCEEHIVYRLALADAIMVCTDSHASRAVVNKLAYQYLIPAVDMGSFIRVADNGDVTLLGRAQLLAPGLACLQCHELLDANRVRYELLDDDQRKRDPYGLPPQVAQPAVISLNSTVSSLAVTMLLQVLTSLDGDARSLRYNGIRGQVRELVAEQVPTCADCSPRYFAAGDSEPLMYRRRSK